ncbi:MAG TPA: two-component regulator propeller domain-containing protein, partial [Bacteroidota bacterium]|nr:two-component regulator propeller domain-containing protein [Bacteroidota bacterium]
MRHAGRRLLFSLPIFALALCSNAQPEFAHLSIREGLSQSTVNCIVQDREGYVWFGTQDGLNRYDGYAFLTLKHDPADSTSLSDNYVTSLCVDGDGVLWVGTRNGLDCWRPETRSFRRYSAWGDNCRALCEGHDHVLWVGTARGLVRINAQRSSAELFAPPGPVGTALSDVRSVLCDSSGVLWIAANARLFRVDPA